MVKIYTVGGFSEVGKNMVVVETEEDAFIFDEGFFLPAIVSMQEREKIITEKKLQSVSAIPDDSIIDKIRHKIGRSSSDTHT
jgi:ribonuclease J